MHVPKVMSNQSLKSKVVKGIFWVVLEKLGTQGVGFIVTMVLTRILTPSDYGTVSMLGIFVLVSSVLADAGLGRALVQKKDASAVDFNSMFYASMILAVCIYGMLFISAPCIAAWYGDERLVLMLRLIALTIIFHSIEGVQQAELNRNLLFNLSFRIIMFASVANMITGITLALFGCGVWALVWSQVVAGIVGVVSRWYLIAWRPALMFSWESLCQLWGYGWKMTVSGLIDTAYGQASSLLIGKIYTPADLAYVERGGSIPNLAMSTVNQAITRVTFPALAQVQDRKDIARDCMRRMIRSSTFLVFPMMVGCAACSSTLVPLLFGDQWGESIPYVWIACLGCALMPFHTINLNGIAALGRSDLFLILEIIKKVLGILLIILFIKKGVFAFVAIRAVVMGPLSVLINSWPNKKLLGYSAFAQCLDVLPTVSLSCAMGVGVWFLGKLHINEILLLAMQILFGMSIYFGFAWLFRVKAFDEYKSIAVSGIGYCLNRFLKSIERC